MSAKKAIQLAKTGNLGAALNEALGCSRSYDLSEQGTGEKSQSQVWFAPNQDALNQFLLRIEDKLPEATYKVEDLDGPPPGYSITVSGTFHDHDVASLAAVKGIIRIDGPNSNLGSVNESFKPGEKVEIELDWLRRNGLSAAKSATARVDQVNSYGQVTRLKDIKISGVDADHPMIKQTLGDLASSPPSSHYLTYVRS